MLNHHAYFYEGSISILPALAAHARKLGEFPNEGSPDVVIREYEKFGIDESRELKNLAALKSSSGASLFVIGVGSITSEAQQALLKLFEEPQAGTAFVLLVPHGNLLPTLRSRCIPFPYSGARSQESGVSQKHSDILQNVRMFLKATHKERQETIAKMLKDDEGVRERVRDFLNALEAELYSKFSKKRGDTHLIRALSDIALFRNYLADRSPSLKMMLEHLAAAVPKL